MDKINGTKKQINEFFCKLLQFQNLVNNLIKDDSLKEKIKYPNLCTIGDIDSGKSSVLESILDLNVLPIGESIYDKRLMELNLIHIDSGDPYAILEDTKYTNFTEITERIFKLFDSFNKNEPIILNIYSQEYPNIKLIDLPGIPRIPIGDCPSNTKMLPILISQKYINDPLNVILCTISAPQSYSSPYHGFSGLRIAKEAEYNWKINNYLRRICIVTKINAMDLQTDAKNTLTNKEMPNELGYVGVLNRSPNDIRNKLSNEEFLKKEKDFFNSNLIYKDLPKELLGHESLMKKISKVYFKLIKDNLSEDIKNNENLNEILNFLDNNSLKDDEINKNK